MKEILLVDDDKELGKILSELFDLDKIAKLHWLHSFDGLKEFDLSRIFAIFLDINLGARTPSGIDCYNYLKESGFKGRIIFFTGHAETNPQVYETLSIPNIRLLNKPASIDQILETIKD